MTEPHDSHEPANVADPHDRLLDCALAEVIGGETPPNLSAQILTDYATMPTNPSRRQFFTWRGNSSGCRDTDCRRNSHFDAAQLIQAGVVPPPGSE